MAVLLVLLATAEGYGWHRDELYFRLLPPAWGYVDQPPLTPLVVHGIGPWCWPATTARRGRSTATSRS